MKEIRLNSPLKGQLIELKDVKDPAFASGAMGKGAAVKDPEGKVYSQSTAPSPCSSARSMPSASIQRMVQIS